MAFIPPVLLVLDVSALAGGSASEWLEFSRVGKVCLPQAVYEDMRLLSDRAPDPDLAELAKRFSHFYPVSGWQVSDASAHHSALTAAGQSLTKRARVSLAAARTAYALSLGFPKHLVVLVTRDQQLLQRIYDLPSNNFCAILPPALLQWSRTGQRPILVSQLLQQMRATLSATMTSGLTHSGQMIPSRPEGRNSTVQRQDSRSGSAKKPQRHSRAYFEGDANEALSNLLSLVLAIAGLALAGWLLWSIFNNSSWLDPLRRPLDPTSQSRVHWE